MNVTELKQKFIEKYGESGADIRVFHAPGRVNLIGEHIDYNGGYVLPAALEFGTTLIIRERQDNKLQLASTNMSYEGVLDTSSIGKEKTGEWTDYPVGVMVELQGKGVNVTKGYDFLYHGRFRTGQDFHHPHLWRYLPDLRFSLWRVYRILTRFNWRFCPRKRKMSS